MEKTYPVLDKIVIFSLYVFVIFSMFSISITQIACGLGGMAWILRTQLTRSWGKQHWPLKIPFALFVLACFLAVATAYNISYSFESLKKLLQILIFFWAVNCIREDRLKDRLVLLLIAAASLAGLFGFYQAWQAGVTIESRVEGTMSVYMTFAGLLMMVGMLALGRVIFRSPVEPWLWPALGIITFCLLLTLTRQAWFGFLMGLIFMLSIWKKKFLLIPAVLFIALVIVPWDSVRPQIQKFSPPNGGSFIQHLKYRTLRIFDGKDETFLIRKNLWETGWEIFKDYPLTGCGFRCVDLVHPQYPDPKGYVKQFRGMHNNFIQLAVDTGILGLTTWVSIWVCFFLILYRKAISEGADRPDRWIVMGSAAAGLAFLAGGCFESNLYDAEVAMLLYFIMSLPFTVPNNEPWALKNQP